MCQENNHHQVLLHFSVTIILPVNVTIFQTPPRFDFKSSINLFPNTSENTISASSISSKVKQTERLDLTVCSETVPRRASCKCQACLLRPTSICRLSFKN